MIIWINGAFGSGKTTTAEELERRIPESFLYDPENVGYFIRNVFPAGLLKSDFQDHKIWREMNVSLLGELARQYSGTIIVPMTLVNPDYFEELVGQLRSQGIEVRHFTLMAQRETLLQRLTNRGEESNSWSARQIGRCLASLSAERFGQHIDTDDLTTEQIIERIAAECEIQLNPKA
ncbi:AAA family ATPase [Saccharibacillus endophyticus]|uniref:Tunicamycin resistance protein n=1 Tax=Saccharibacillus endophyticus TaxID=2060666 RepID=A0ABQ1ZJ94_9BACL|nr:AAA family ATPase [Saccharibacillus endophyticus]GGH68439.1 tunicamycin resistance protein [Saccharibacillus endophyticus]